MELQGKIEKFSVPDIFHLIFSSRRTGTLGINRGEQSVLFYFNDGQITYAYSSNCYTRIGERLTASNIIDIVTLNKSLIVQKQQPEHKRLGAILLEEKLIDEDQLKIVLTEQVTDIIKRVMAWDNGVFKFYDGKFPTREELDLALQTRNLILEGISQAEELNRLKQHLPDFNSFLRIKQLTEDDGIELKLSSMDWNIMTLCDGHRNINMLINDSAYSPTITLNTITGLIENDLIDISDKSGSEPFSSSYSQLESQLETLSNMIKEFLEKG